MCSSRAAHDRRHRPRMDRPGLADQPQSRRGLGAEARLGPLSPTSEPRRPSSTRTAAIALSPRDPLISRRSCAQRMRQPVPGPPVARLADAARAGCSRRASPEAEPAVSSSWSPSDALGRPWRDARSREFLPPTASRVQHRPMEPARSFFIDAGQRRHGRPKAAAAAPACRSEHDERAVEREEGSMADESSRQGWPALRKSRPGRLLSPGHRRHGAIPSRQRRSRKFRRQDAKPLPQPAKPRPGDLFRHARASEGRLVDARPP